MSGPASLYPYRDQLDFIVLLINWGVVVSLRFIRWVALKITQATMKRFKCLFGELRDWVR